MIPWIDLVEARPRRDVRPAPPMAAPAPEPPPPEAAPIPPVAWSTGMVEGTALSGAPTERWGRTLDNAVVGPVASDGRHVVVSLPDMVLGFDLDGRQLWQQPIRASTGPVLLADGAWVGGGDGRVYVLDPATGAVVRKLGEGGPPVLAPLVPEGKHVWWIDGAGTLGGSAGWSAALVSPAPSLAVDSGTVYVTTRTATMALGREGPRWTTPLEGPGAWGPALTSGHQFVGVDATAGRAGGVCAFARDGAAAWCFRSDFGPGAPVAVTEGLVILPDRDGHLYALAAADGALRWKVEGFGAFTSRPLVVGGAVYAGNGDGLVYAVDPDDGGVLWSVNLGAPVAATPTRAGELLLVPLTNGRIVALAAE